MIKIRCSSLSYIMTEPKSKKDRDAGNLSETAKTHLIDLFVANEYKRNTDIFNKYVNKGLMVEEDSITLYSMVKKRFFYKNTERLENDFINGEPDLFIGKDINSADAIIDIKSSWDLYTFMRVKYSKVINENYWCQLQGYMWLTGAKVAYLAYCLVDTPELLINDEKRKLLYRMGVATDENKDYLDACEEIERSMTFSDIPMSDRLFEIKILRDDSFIEKAKERIIKCREHYEQIFKPIK